MKKQSHQHGFTLVETILSVTIIAMVITAAAQLTSSSLDLGRSSMQQFIAYHSAEEGIEMVRNIRDTNWLQNTQWRNGLSDGTYIIEASLDGPQRFSLRSVAALEPTLKANEMQRHITITSSDEEPDVIHVESTVYFLSRNVRHVTVTTDLTDWKRGPL